MTFRLRARQLFFLLLAAFVLLSPLARASQQEPELRIGVIADIQYAPEKMFDRRDYEASLGKFEKTVGFFNTEDLDFVIQLGDLIDRDFDNYGTILGVWEKLKAPAYHVLGNHEFSVDKAEKPKITERLGLQKKYYDFDFGKWRFVVLDGNDLSLYAHPEDSPEYREAQQFLEEMQKKNKINASSWNGGVGPKQFQWLRETLASACAAGEKVIVFSHFPVYPPHPTNLWNDTEIVKELETHSCVFAYVNGHNHDGAYGVKKGIHYLTVEGVITSGEANAYAVFEIFPERVDVRGYGKVPSRTLTMNAGDIIETRKGKGDPVLEVMTAEKPETVADFKKVPLQESAAYHQYTLRPESELSKLRFLMDRFKAMQVVIIYDRREFATDVSVKQARRYLQKHYNNENAIEWIRVHAYRAKHAGDVILVQYPDGTTEGLRDAFLNELEELENLEKARS
ncbi:MAG: metallophosphoesterase [Candidatus Omnitrophica bacterium]|nr:metallophosphoesterase [Candidatus Omnitrophota bacterium]